MAATTMPGTPAGFWRRSAAWGLDWLLLSPLVYLLIRPGIRSMVSEFSALRTQLEQWLLSQSGQAESAFDLWLLLSRSALTDTSLQASVATGSLRLCSSLTWSLAIASLLASVYFIVFETSPWQATPGKRVLGLRVLAMDGHALTMPRAALRYFAGSLSWLSLNLGHALALVRRDGRALHDLIAGTAVVARSTDA